MTALEKFKEGAFGPAVVLTTICLVMALALAGVYQMTRPLIIQQEIESANRVRKEVLPKGDNFEVLNGNWPDGVTEVYAADNGEGMVIRSGAKGFDGTVTFMIGMNWDGEVTGIDMFDHSETPGLGTKIGATDFLEQYYGEVDPWDIDGVTGATRTSNALKNALAQAREAFEMIRGEQ